MPARLAHTLVCLVAVSTTAAPATATAPQHTPAHNSNTPDTTRHTEPDRRLGSLSLRHAGDVTALSFAVERGVLTSRSLGDGPRSWDLDDGSAVALEADAPPALAALLPAGPARQSRLSPSGRHALCWSYADDAVQLWQLDERDQPAAPRAVELDGRAPYEACFSDDGAALLIVGERISGRADFGTWVRRHAPGDGALVWEVERPGVMPSALVALPATDEHAAGLVLAGRDGRVDVLDLADGELRRSWRAHDGQVTRVASSADGAWLLSGGSGGEVALWSLAAAAPTDEAPPLAWRAHEHGAAITSLALSADLGLVASGGRDHCVRLYALHDGRPRLRPTTHATRLTTAALSSSGALVATASWAGTLGLWDGDGRQRARVDAHHGRITGLALLEPAGLLVSTGQDGRLCLTRVDDGTPAAAPLALDTALLALDGTADGRHLASAGADGLVQLWSLAHDAQGAPQLVPQGSVQTGGRGSFALAYAADGSLLAIGTSSVHVVHAATGEVRWEWAAGAPVGALAVSHDGALVAAGLASRQVVVLDSQDGSEVWRWTDLPGRVAAVAFGPDGRLAVAGGDASVRLRRPGDSADGARLEGHLETVTSLRWLAGGTLLTAAADGTAALWSP